MMDDHVNGSDERQREIERIAAEWVVRVNGPRLREADRMAFEDWLAADVAHRAAFEHANRAWSDLDILKSQPGQLRSVIAPVAKPSRSVAARRTRNAVIGLALLGTGALAILFQTGNPWIALAADYRTGAGEVRTVRLNDGTIVDLGASSAIAVEFNNNVRRVRLLTGEAYFTVAPKQGPEQRAFVAAASEGTTTALGTQFSVEDIGSSAIVTAVEHQIEVAVPAAGRRDRVVLSPGDIVQYDTGSGIGAIRKADTAAATAWRQGLLVFDNVPLSEAVARLNRYRRGRIVVMNTSLGERRVSGVFPSDSLDNVVETISAELGAHAVSTPLVTLLY
jgi:transmembrane sensor